MWHLQVLPVLCPCTRGSKLGKLEVREPPTHTHTHTRKVALVSVKTQIEIQTAQVKVQTTPVSVWPQTTLVSIETQTIEVRDEMRTGDKEIKISRFLQSIPGIICTEQPERLRNSHTSCCFFIKHPLGEIISLWELISLFLIKKIQKSRRIWETRGPRKNTLEF